MIIIAYRANGSTSNIERIHLYKDSGATSGTEGDPITGLTHNSTGLSISSIANNEASATTETVAGTDDIEDITTGGTLGTYAAPTSGKVRFEEVDSTAHPGLYELQFADARYAVSNAKYLDICITGVADLATMHGRIYLDVIDEAAIDQVLQDYDSSAGVVSNTDLNARTIATASIPTKTDVSDVSADVTSARDTILGKLLAYIQLLFRKDSAIGTDNAAEVTAINADEGSGAGTYDNTTDSLEATQDDITALNDITSADVWAELLGNSGYSASAIVQIMAGAIAGKISGAGTSTITIRSIEDDANIIVATVDASGNRSLVTITTPGD